MDWLDKLKQAVLTKSERTQPENPWEDSAPAAPQENVNPWKPHPKRQAAAKPTVAEENLWVKPGRGFKENVLRKASFILILLNIAVGLLFYSNNLQFNLALYTYLGASTLVIGHYISLTR
jgi:hypothetical protein